jgi:hypothetical protein
MRGADTTPAKPFRAEAACEKALEEEHFNMVEKEAQGGGRQEDGRRDAFPFFPLSD